MNRLSEIKDPAPKSRAVEIKEYCSRELEFINTQGLFRFYNRHGPSHSQKVWENIKKILERKNVVVSEYELFLAEAAAWCHDLGMIKEIGENFDEPKVCEEVRNTHHERILKYIPEHWKELSLGNEPEALLLANICWAHSSKADLSKLKEKDEILVGENVGKVRTRFLGALLRLADALDAGKDRLPPENYRDHPEIPVSTHKEYWKHEVVDSVKIQDGNIILQMLVKYEYPVDVVEEVKKKLNDELESVKGVLCEYGIDFKFDFLVNESAVKIELSQEDLEPSFETRKPPIYEDLNYEKAHKYRLFFEPYIREFIAKQLKGYYGEKWWSQGVPKGVRNDCRTRKNNDPNGIGKPDDPLILIEYMDLSEYWEVFKFGKNWKDIFEEPFRKEGLSKVMVEAKLQELGPLRNIEAHAKSKIRLTDDGVDKFEHNISDLCVGTYKRDFKKLIEKLKKKKPPIPPSKESSKVDKSALFEVTTRNELGNVAKNTNFLENSEGDFESKKTDVFYFGDKSEVDKRIQNILDELGPQRILFITGPPATGKSTFLLFFLDECFRKPLKDIRRWQTIFFLNPREEMKKSLERIDEILKVDYKNKIFPENILLVIDALHRKEEREVENFSELFEKIRKDGYSLITTIRDNELNILIDKMGDLKEKFGVEWEKEDLKLEHERMQRIFVNWLIYHNEKSKIELEDIDLSFEEIKNYFLEGEVVPPEKIESYQKFGECARIASRKSNGLAGYIKYLVEDISKRGKFSKEIIEEYPEGMTKLILRIIERDYFIKKDEIFPSLILLLAKQKEPITLEFINSFVDWGVNTIDKGSFDNLDSVKKDILDKVNNLVRYYTSTTRKDGVELYKLISHWKDAIEDLEHNDGWMNEFRNANRMLKGRIADYLLHIKEKLEKENLEREEIPSGEWPAVADAAKLSYEKGDNELLEHATNFFGGISKMYRDVEQYIFLQNTLSLLWTEISSKAHESKDYDLAVEAIENAIKVNSEDATLHSLAGNFYREKGDLSGALEHYYRATEIEPNNITYLGQLGAGLEDWGMALEKGGSLPKAISKFEDAVKSYEKAIQIIEGLNKFEKGQRKRDWNRYCWRIGYCSKRAELIRMRLRSEDEKCLKDKAEQYFMEGKNYETKGDYDTALKMFKHAKELMSKYIEIKDIFEEDIRNLISSIYRRIGVCYENNRDYEKAAEHYTIHADLNEYAPDSLKMYKEYGNKFRGWKLYAKAIYCFAKALKFDQNNYEFLSELADLSDRMGKFDDALKYYKESLEEQKAVIGVVAESDKEWLDKYKKKLKIRDLIGKKLVSICNTVDLALNEKIPEEEMREWLSNKLYEDGMSLGEINPKNVIDPGKIFEQREKEKIRNEIENIKISCLCRAIVIDRNNYMARNELERITGRSCEEICNEYNDYFRRKLEREKENPLGALCRVHSQVISTLNSLHGLRIKGIKKTEVKNRLSGYWGWIGAKIDRIYKEDKYMSKISPNVAVKCFELSLKLRERNKNSSGGLGWALFYAGRYDEAIQAFNDDLREDMNPDSPASTIGIGSAYNKKGDYETAEKYLRKGAKLDFKFRYDYDPQKVIDYLKKSTASLEDLAFLCDSRNEKLRLLKEALDVYKMMGEIAQEIKLEDEQNLFKLEAANLEKYIGNVEMVVLEGYNI